jgi:molybdate transport system ATP-binding protein
MSIECRFNIVRADFVLDVDLSLSAKGVTAIFGPSGSGKTTFLRSLAGLEKNKGYLKVGEVIWQDEQHFVPTHKRSIAYVFQEASLFEHLNVKDNIEYGFKRATDSDQSVMQRAIKLLQIEHLLDRRVHQLSGGERQRVAIARALSTNPDMLLMDEPLASLGDKHKKEILPFLELLHRELEIPMIYVSHSIDEVAQLADHLILLDEGSVVGNGKISEMLTRLDLSLSHGERAASIIEAKVLEHDDNYNLTMIDFSGGRFFVPRKQLPIGCDVRLRIEARDVSLTTQRQDETSILNILPAIVDEIVDEGDAQVIVRLRAGDDLLLSCITKKSADLLKLQIGKEVYAQIKSVALLS